MAQRRWLTKVLVFVMLEAGALIGVPMRPDQIEDLTRLMNGTRLEQVVRRENDGDDDPPR